MERSQLNIGNSTVTGNSASRGGAIHLVEGKLISSNCAYNNNSAGVHGGAVNVNDRSTAVFTNDVITRNKSGEGGGVHVASRSDVVFRGCVLKQNTANEGAGLYNSGDSKADVDSCVFDHNIAQQCGGGVDNRGKMNLVRSRIINNSANAGNAVGGGVNQRGTLTVNRCEISHNTAQNGAGIYVENNSVQIANTTVSKNNAALGGGGLYLQTGRCEITFVTVTGNRAPQDMGSGIMGHSRPVVRNSIISGNTHENNIDGVSLFETGDDSSEHNIIGAVYYAKGNQKGKNVAFKAAQHLGALTFNRNSFTQSHALVWLGSSTNNPAVGKAVPISNYKYDQTGMVRNRRYPSLGAYEEAFFKAFDDGASTNNNSSGSTSVQLLANDSYPENCIPNVVLSSTSSPKAVHIGYSKDPDVFYYLPKASSKGYDSIKYIIECPGGYRDSAYVIIEIGLRRDRPQNIKDEMQCMIDMPAVKFNIHRKIFNDKVQVDGFSSPLVGDLNGDGKPEIVGLGVVNDIGNKAGGLDAVGKSIVIYDGQTGNVLLDFDLNTLKKHKFDSESGYGTRFGFQLRWDPRHNSYSHLAIADLDSDRKGEIIVAETGSGQVYALKPKLDHSGKIEGLEIFWDGEVLHKAPEDPGKYDNSDAETFGAPVPYVSDLNGDGIPDVIVYNKIYNGITGALELELETLNMFSYPDNSDKYKKSKNYAYVGRIPGAIASDDCIPVIAVNDIDGDGVMEIIAGSKIYKLNIVDPANTESTNSWSVIQGPESVKVENTTYYLTDGFTVVADIDGDDALDVIVVKRIEQNKFMIYVWDPRLSGNVSLKAVLVIEQTTNQGLFSVPFVGDINGHDDGWDGKAHTLKLPEICMTIGKLKTKDIKHRSSHIPDYTSSNFTKDEGGQIFRGHVVAFTYDSEERDSTKRLKLSWMMKHSDISHQTGIVMFDFDADGVNELVYRDELSLRVISPANRADGFDFINLKMDSKDYPDVIRFRETGISSYTGYESPVIADVNGDGSADIITFGIESEASTGNSAGHLFVYGSLDGSWAPTRPVWNQGIYYPLQINDNLTVPRHPQSTLTKYYSKHPDPVRGPKNKGKYIQPFNGNWIQQPIVRTNNYVPIMMTADPLVQLNGLTVTQTTQTTAKATVTVENRGEAAVNASMPLMFYHTKIDPANKIGRFVLKHDIYPGESKSISYTLPGNRLGKVIYVRLSDDGYSFPARSHIDCDPTNNVAYTMLIDAVDDYFSRSDNNLTYLNVCKNDVYDKNITPQIEIIESARHGSAIVVSGSTISYLPDLEFQGIDTIRYRIRCNDGEVTGVDEAMVYVLVLKPEAQEYIACPGASIPLKLNPVAGIKYGWYDVETGGTPLVGGKKNEIVYVKKNGDEALWVQVSATGFDVKMFPRFKINLPLSDVCGSDKLSDCAINGTLLFSEDFGGDAPDDNGVIEKHGQFCKYQLDDLCEGSVLNISAWMAKISGTSKKNTAGLVFVIEDPDGNTLSKYYPGELPEGASERKNYGFSFTVPHRVSSVIMRIINDNNVSGNNFVIDDIAIHLCVPKVGFTDNGNQELCIDASHEFKATFVDDGSFGNDLVYRLQFRNNKSERWRTVITDKHTGPIDITLTTTVVDDGYYRLVVGNEDVIDCANCPAVSTEIYRKTKDCLTKINIEGNSPVCLNQTFTLKFNYPDTGNPSRNNVFYRWEFRHVDSDVWQILDEQTATAPLNIERTIDRVDKSSEGYHRIRIGRRGGSNSANCCNVSDSVPLTVIDAFKVPDIRIQLSPQPNRVVRLMDFVDSIPHARIRWERVALHSPAIINSSDETTGSINTADFVKAMTYTYKYIASSQCSSSEARVYIRTVKDRIFRTPDTIMICRDNKSSESVNINNILGLELGGKWKYDNTVNPDATVADNVTVMPPSSSYAGATIFNAVKAYDAAPKNLYSHIYHGYNTAKSFKFVYTPSAESNIAVEKKLVIVVL
jgi:hypothetical protein